MRRSRAPSSRLTAGGAREDPGSAVCPDRARRRGGDTAPPDDSAWLDAGEYLQRLAEPGYRPARREQPAQRLVVRVLVLLMQPGDGAHDLRRGEGRAVPGGPGIRAED